MNHSALILCSFLIAVPLCAAEIKSAAPRSGLEPSEKSPPKPAAPAAPLPEKSTDPRTPSANLLKDLALVEKIHAEPAKARETITRCGNLRNGLAAYPAHFQKLHSCWAIALANSGDMNAASEKFAIASSTTAPDQTLAVRALNEQTRFLLRSPDGIQKALDSVTAIVARTGKNSPEQMTALFHGACGLFIFDRSDQAIGTLEKIQAPLHSAKGDAALAALRQNTAHLLSALHAAKAARNPDNPPHIFHAPWRGVEITGGLGIHRRIADLAFVLRDFPRALTLYNALEKEAATKGQPEIRSWSRMQRARVLSITGNPGESEKLLTTFLTVSPYKEARCAPFAILHLGLLYHNRLKDIPKAQKAFESAATCFRGTLEAAQAQYYRAMIPQLQNKPREALPLLVAYTETYPKHPQTDYLKEHLIPAIEKQLAAKTVKPAVR